MIDCVQIANGHLGFVCVQIAKVHLECVCVQIAFGICLCSDC